jgi:hypothetical protein
VSRLHSRRWKGRGLVPDTSLFGDESVDLVAKNRLLSRVSFECSMPAEGVVSELLQSINESVEILNLVRELLFLDPCFLRCEKSVVELPRSLELRVDMESFLQDVLSGRKESVLFGTV